jgi:hypothetical protein
MLIYAFPTRGSVHCRTLRQGTTIGHFIDQIIALKMHHFLSLPYTVHGRWKGCGVSGDRVNVLSIRFPTPKTILTLCLPFPRSASLHCWAHGVRQGDITIEQSVEDANMPAYVKTSSSQSPWRTRIHVHPGWSSTRECIGRGW